MTVISKCKSFKECYEILDQIKEYQALSLWLQNHYEEKVLSYNFNLNSFKNYFRYYRTKLIQSSSLHFDYLGQATATYYGLNKQYICLKFDSDGYIRFAISKETRIVLEGYFDIPADLEDNLDLLLSLI